jgi:manganese/zinc/iron transport system permease protein
VGWLIDLLPLSYPDAVVVVGAAVIGLAAGVLGALAVLQQRSLVGDALAHAALPGVALAFIVTGAKDPTTLLLGAALTGLVGSLMMVGIERSSRTRPDAAIGVVLSGFFSLGIVLLTYVAGTGNAQQAGLERYLFGQAAGLLESDVDAMAVLAAIGIGLVAIAFRALKTTLFDRSFAATAGLPVRAIEIAGTALLVVAIIIGLRAVGAILMVAMLVVPTVTARQFADRLSRLLPLAGAVGMLVGVVGALIAARTAVPTGPVIVLVGVALAVLAVLFAPGRGVLWRARARGRARRTALTQGVLLDLETAMHTGPPPTVEQLRLATGRSRRRLAAGLGALDEAGLLARDGERVMLNEQGAAAAHAALESRRLWDAWLEFGSQMPLDDAREPDPRDIRASLGDEVADRLTALAAGRAQA